jgi:hypothetical protein
MNHLIVNVIDKLLGKDGEWYNKKKKKKLVEGIDVDADVDDDWPQRSLPEAKPEEEDCLVSSYIES